MDELTNAALGNQGGDTTTTNQTTTTNNTGGVITTREATALGSGGKVDWIPNDTGTHNPPYYDVMNSNKDPNTYNATTKQGQYNIDSDYDFIKGEINLNLPTEPPSTDCYSGCATQAIARETKCEVLRRRVEMALKQAGCPTGCAYRPENTCGCSAPASTPIPQYTYYAPPASNCQNGQVSGSIAGYSGVSMAVQVPHSVCQQPTSVHTGHDGNQQTYGRMEQNFVPIQQPQQTTQAQVVARPRPQPACTPIIQEMEAEYFPQNSPEAMETQAVRCRRVGPGIPGLEEVETRRINRFQGMVDAEEQRERRRRCVEQASAVTRSQGLARRRAAANCTDGPPRNTVTPDQTQYGDMGEEGPLDFGPQDDESL